MKADNQSLQQIWAYAHYKNEYEETSLTIYHIYLHL